MSDQHYPHAAHRGHQQALTLADMPAEQLPSYLLHPESAPVQAMLEDLDDVIFSAVGGNAEALELANKLWPVIVETIGWDLVEESREQYLRFAIDVTQQFENANQRTPVHAIAALEIISLLTR